MAPRHKDEEPDEVTWTGVQDMISEYDRSVILPRENTRVAVQRQEHETNTSWLRRLEDSVQGIIAKFGVIDDKFEEIKKEFSEQNKVLHQAKGAFKVIIRLLLILIAITSPLLVDWVVWFIKSGYHSGK